MIPIFLFNYRFCDYFAFWSIYGFQRAASCRPTKVFLCVFGNVREAKIDKREKKKEKEKKNISFSPLFLCFVPVQWESRKAYRSSSPCVYDMAFYLILLPFFLFSSRLDPNSVSSSQVPFVSLSSGSASSDLRGLFWERNYDDHDFTCFHSSFFFFFLILITLDLAFRLTVSFLIDSLTFFIPWYYTSSILHFPVPWR